VRIFLGEEMEVDLVPSFMRAGGGYLIPNGKAGWRAANPPFHHDLSEASNVRLASRLKPLVRLMKAWNNANGHPVRSFHIEMMVTDAARGATVVPAWASAVASSLAAISTRVTSPFPDPWTPPVQFVDDDLTATRRVETRDMLRSDAATSVEALRLDALGRTREAFALWDRVYRGKFPAYG
jgi:hypothetical protein